MKFEMKRVVALAGAAVVLILDVACSRGAGQSATNTPTAPTTTTSPSVETSPRPPSLMPQGPNGAGGGGNVPGGGGGKGG